MKTVYIKRNDLFKPLDMVLCNEITKVDDSFIEDNYEMFTYEVDDSEVDEKISDLSQIDWTREEYKPFDITDKMTPKEIEEHLKDDFFESVRDDIEGETDLIEPYQYFIVDGQDYDIERLKEFNITLGYSNALEVHVLPIYDFGTSWSAFSHSKEVSDDYVLGNDESFTNLTNY